ncbi:Calx-beta domain-containing protein [Maribacter arcticus]|uniref:Conserved repeat domain-containing protein/gliding motility-associated C-terminal domain-containing protein n=1 Tax=Maribacter arcticus TaxID=561365 RepID=A0A1T5AVA4_9FLAO|nr:Calx-beta domain-containing protein [Maribacter arcticus]SKB38739.1 conserved repeat domain-containing protein/gliding motility-associated C-terminal domain-containing protein [Maribacter arcticus]
MKMKLHSIFLNITKIIDFNLSILVFSLFFLSVSLGGIFGQTVSIANNADALEGSATPGNFRVSVASLSDFGTVTVKYIVLASSTATAGVDYTALSGEVDVTYTAFISNALINVNTAFQDVLLEGTETVVVEIVPDGAYTLGANKTAAVNIVDDDTATLSVTDISANEGNGLVFSIVADKAALFSYTVNVNFQDGTAIGGAPGLVEPEDYNNVMQPINFPIGSTNRQFTVPTLNDNVVENNETFNVILSANNANVDASDTAIGTINDDDVGNITIEDITEIEGNKMGFRVTNNILVPNAFTVTVNFVDISATGGDVDYKSDPKTLNFSGAAGQGRDFDVDTYDDNLIEGTETFTVTLSSNEALVDDSDTAIGTILDNDVFRASILATDNSATEANTVTDTGTFTVSLDEVNSTGSPITINYVVGGSAVSGTDYTALLGTVQILNGQQSNTIVVTPINDNLVENTETVIVELTAGSLYDLGNSGSRIGTISILDTDTFTATIEATAATANESPSTNGTFTVDLGAVNNTGASIAVNYTTAGTATPNSDYTTLNGTVQIANGQRVNTITVTPINDTTVEENETVIVSLSTGSRYTIGNPGNAIVTIVSDDANVARITAIDATAAESNGAAATGEFTISLSAPNNTGSTMTINYVVSGTAVNGTDYTAISANAIDILPGEQSVPIIIDPFNDLIQEGVESVIITLASGSGYVLGAASTRSATVQINDNDQAILEVTSIPFNEDDPSGVLVFNVELSIAVVGGTQVSYSFFDDSATGGGTDYTGTPGTLIFTGTANETKTITVPINNDAVLENTETFEVQLGLPTNNVQLVNGGTAIGTINDDDNCVAAPVLDASVSPIYCVVDTGSAFSANLFDFTTSIAPSGTVLTWSRVSNPLTITSHLSPAEAQDISTPASYYGFFYDAANNCASGNIEVQIVRNIIPQLVTINGNERCGPGTLLLSAIPSDGASVNWYNSLESDTPIAFGETFTTPPLTVTTTYYVEATENECTTERQPVIARIGFQATAGTAQNASICNIATNGLTSLDLDSRLTGADPGVWIFVSGPEDVNINSTNVVDFEGLASGAYIFRFTTTNSTAPCVNPTIDITINVSDCESDDDNDGLLGGQEVALGLDPNNPDTDGDGIEDGEEVGADIANPLDEDNDGIIDALDSNTDDADNDGVNDQQDPANDNPCIPNRFNGSCDTDGDGLSDLDEQTNGSDPDDPCDPVATPNCDDPIDLEVLKSVDNINAQIGDTVVFEIMVTNLSDRTVRAIVIGDLLELGFDFVSKSSVDYDEISGIWDIAELEAGLSVVLNITVTVSEEGPYENTATLLESIPSDNNPANDESTVTLNTEVPEGIDLEVIKNVDNKTPLLGEQITFTIRVENKSVNGDIISNIQIDDILPEGADAGFIYISDVSTAGDFNEATGRWTIESLEVGEQNAVTLEITVSVPIEGAFTNIATLVRSSPTDSNEANNSSTVDVEVSIPTPADPGFLFNQFSPNGDGTNDVLRINLRDSEAQVDQGINYKIVIYDRYGNLVFEGANLVASGTQTTVDVWDGNYKGKKVPKGTYFYIMNYSINNEPVILDKGWIQLIR